MVIAATALNFPSKQAIIPVKSFLQRLLSITDIVRAYLGKTVEAVKLDSKLVQYNSLFDALKLKPMQKLFIAPISF